jgi:hypothetical protein
MPDFAQFFRYMTVLCLYAEMHHNGRFAIKPDKCHGRTTMRNRIMRGAAIGAASTMLAGGAAFATAGAATAAPTSPTVPSPTDPRPDHNNKHDNHKHCHWQKGHVKWVHHHAYKDRHGHWHHGFWFKVWVPGHWVCVSR